MTSILLFAAIIAILYYLVPAGNPWHDLVVKAVESVTDMLHKIK